jgi:hypothetical protein
MSVVVIKKNAFEIEHPYLNHDKFKKKEVINEEGVEGNCRSSESL